jgi:hypothetical protein
MLRQAWHAQPSIPSMSVAPARPLPSANADGKLLLTGSDDSHANLYDTHSGGLVDSFSGGWAVGRAVGTCGWDRGRQKHR